MTEYHVRSRPGGTTVRVSRPGGVTRVRTRLAGGSAGGAGLTTEETQDLVAAMLDAGDNITLTYDDNAGTLTIDAAGGGGGATGDSEIVATSTTLTGPPHTIAVAAAGSIDITVTLPDATVDDKGLVWYIRNLNSDSVVYVANLAEGDETITESKGLLVSGIETDTPGTYAWMKVGFVSETGTSGGGADLSDTTPQALGTAAAGTGTAAARDDHVHAMPTAADVGADADGAAQAVADSLGDAATKDVGTTAGTVAAGDDARLSDARTPTAHASSHASVGPDPVTLAQSQVTNLTTDLAGKAASSHVHAGTDITSGTVGTARLGSGSATSSTFLRGDQTWATPTATVDVVSNVATARILGRTTSGSGDSEELTAAQTRTLLGVGISGTEPRISPTIGGTKRAVFPMGHRGGTTANQNANTIRALTFPMSVYWNLDEAWVEVTTLASGKNMRVGLWSLNSSWTPTLVWDSGNVSVGTTGLKKITASQTNLSPGTYMLGLLCEATTGVRYHYSTPMFNESTAAIGASPIPIIDISHTFGTLPTSPTIATSGSAETYTAVVMVTSEA